MPDLDERFSDALHSTARAWRQAVNRRLKSLGVSQASWMSIAMVAKASRPMSQSELAERLGVEAATVVAMIDRLVKAGFVTREPSHTDRRVNWVVLTEVGQKLYQSVKVQAIAVRKTLLADIDPEQLAAATELLETLHRIIDSGP